MQKILIGLIALSSISAFASDLKDCEKKIAELVNRVKVSEVEVSPLAPTGRKDQYHLSYDRMCGVELMPTYLTITKFTEPADDGQKTLTAAKFETIILNGNDPTFTNSRVKAIVTCTIGDNSVEYITKVPVLTDGVKSPYVIEKLTIKQELNDIHLSLRASVTPISGVFRSITDCTLSVQ